MLAEIVLFHKWLRPLRENPHATTPTHYVNDVILFFNWADRDPAEVRVTEVQYPQLADNWEWRKTSAD